MCPHLSKYTFIDIYLWCVVCVVWGSIIYTTFHSISLRSCTLRTSALNTLEEGTVCPQIDLANVWFCVFAGLPWWPGKESGCQCRRCEFEPRGWEIPWRRKWQPTPVFLPGKSHGQRRLVGYSPWGCKVDRTWRLNKYTEACFKGWPQGKSRLWASSHSIRKKCQWTVRRRGSLWSENTSGKTETVNVCSEQILSTWLLSLKKQRLKSGKVRVRAAEALGVSMGGQTRAPALAHQGESTGHLGEELVMLCSGWCL